ncbi:MAG: DUF1553 domain-containing protein, partial [Planctomycetaceae bacterium]|nr:DUF1553 domain-containing protein [Planctomycetaceae bacterium]
PPPVFIPGKERLGEVEPGFLTIFAPEPVAPEILPDLPASSGRRTVLANWLTRPDHPLTTRVIVNRIWQEHFGQGIVPTPNDFGHLGEAPSHPELLDWLATSFVSNGWSLKWLHREIVLSAAYRQQAVIENAQASLIDPANRLMWRAPLRRLSAEQIRDGMLVAGGEIEHKLGGAPDDAVKSKRRSIYCKVMRNKPDDMLSAFDLPDRMRSTGDRNTTTTPSQALLLINSQQIMARGTALARRVQQDVPETFSSQIDRAFQIAFGRPADPQELELLSTFADSLTTTIKPAMIDVATVPGTEISGVLIDDAKHPALELADRTDLPTADFTLEAVINLHSRYPDTKVRTIMSQWDGETSHSGWSLGVTSTKSKYTPGNLALQLIGEDEKGILTYEVIASGLILEVDHPYSVSVSVTAKHTSDKGILFRVVDLATQEEQTSFQSHRVVQKFHPELPLIIGGRAGSDEFKWDGHLGSIRLTLHALAAEELKTELPARPHPPQAVWEFKESSPTQIDSVQQWALFPYDNNKTPSALVDACHVLLNSNEFLYVE